MFSRHNASASMLMGADSPRCMHRRSWPFAHGKMTSKPANVLPDRLGWMALVALCILANSLQAQDHTLVFSTSAAGVSKAITNWGLDVTWPNYDNMRRGLIFMGTNAVDMVRVAFQSARPLRSEERRVGKECRSRWSP